MWLLIIELVALFLIVYSIPIDIKGMYFLSLAIWNKIKFSKIEFSTIVSDYANSLYQYEYLELFKSTILSIDLSLAILSLLIWTLIRDFAFNRKEPLILIKDYKLLNLICLFLIISIPIEMVIFLVKNWGFFSFTPKGGEIQAAITLMNSLNCKLMIFVSIQFVFSFLLLFTSMSINNKIALSLIGKFLLSCTADLFDLLKYVLFAWSDIDSQLDQILLFLNRQNRFAYKKWK